MRIMRNRKILADYRRLREEAYQIYANHLKSCEKCANEEKCVEEYTILTIIEHFDEIHYKYDCNC